MNKGIGVVVLAGAANKGRLAAVSSEAAEALIPVAGKPMLDWVLTALTGVPNISAMAVVGPPEITPVLSDFPQAKLVPSGDTLLENLERGVAALGARQERILLVTADIPLLTPAAIQDFLARAAAVPAALHYPILTREVSNQAFPGVERTYVRLRDGVFTGGNIFLFEPAMLERCTNLLRKVIKARKRPWELASLFGLSFILAFLLRRLTIKQLEARATQLLGAPARAIISPYPEIGVDVDKPSDLEVVERALGKNS